MKGRKRTTFLKNFSNQNSFKKFFRRDGHSKALPPIPLLSKSNAMSDISENYASLNQDQSIEKLPENAQSDLSVEISGNLDNRTREDLIAEINRYKIELEHVKKLNDAANKRFEQHYNRALSAYFTIDISGYIWELNQNAANFLRKDLKSLIGTALNNFLDVESKLKFETFLNGVVVSRQKQTCELVFCIGEQDIIYVHVEGILSNEPDLILLMAIDISERRQAEEALRTTEEKYRILLDESSDPIFTFYPDGRYIYVNKAFADGVGKKQDEIIGRRIYDIFSREEAEKRFSAMKWVFENKVVKVIQVCVPREEGNHFYITTIKPIFNEMGQVINVICISKEITERKHAEDLLKTSEEKLVILNQQLKELNASKDKFFSIIAHDLKNPFNAIIGFSNLIRTQIRRQNYEAVEEYASTIQNSSFRAMSLLMNLLDWARCQIGRMDFNPELLDLISLIDVVIDLANDSASQKSITITKRLPSSLIAFADKNMISTILRNLISNAIKFSFPGDEIIISTEDVVGDIKINVIDRGVGIKKESIEKLWRIDQSYSTIGTQKEKGTGLGLLLCKEFIEKHGGRIGVESEAGKGSTFYIIIPNRDVSINK